MEHSQKKFVPIQVYIPFNTSRLLKIAVAIEGISVKKYVFTVIEDHVHHSENLKNIKLT